MHKIFSVNRITKDGCTHSRTLSCARIFTETRLLIGLILVAGHADTVGDLLRERLSG
jgi:hypothetical protein